MSNFQHAREMASVKLKHARADIAKIVEEEGPHWSTVEVLRAIDAGELVMAQTYAGFAANAVQHRNAARAHLALADIAVAQYILRELDQ
jgi:hypothetical protein